MWVGKKDHEKLQGATINSYSLIRPLGGGAFAVVYQAFDQKTNQIIAIKVIPKFLMVKQPKLKQLVDTQIRVLKQCNNTNVVKFVDDFVGEKSVFIAMEYCNGGDLQGLLKSKPNGRLSQSQAVTYLKQILNGFKGLHEVNAMHRDFKVANVLIHDGQCKIADLGFAKQMQKPLTITMLGTSLTMAPQLLQNRPYGIKADIYSVGVVFYQMLHGNYPHNGQTDASILKSIKFNKVRYDLVELSEQAKDFISKCLVMNPEQRINWHEIYDHPLIKQKPQKLLLNNLMSRIKIQDNKQFYNKQKQVKINDEFIYPQINQKLSLNKKQPQKIYQSQKANLQRINKIKQINKRVNEEVNKYYNAYVQKRRNIMFIFQYIVPLSDLLIHLRANHAIVLALLCKNTYNQMKNYSTQVKNKQNFLKIQPYFKQFTENSKYKLIQQNSESDCEIIKAQLIAFTYEIGNCSKQIKIQIENEEIKNKNWNKLLQDQINSYQFQLGEEIIKVKGQQKQILLKLVQSLNYYKQNLNKVNIQVFQTNINKINYQDSQVKLKSKVQSFLRG